LAAVRLALGSVTLFSRALGGCFFSLPALLQSVPGAFFLAHMGFAGFALLRGARIRCVDGVATGAWRLAVAAAAAVDSLCVQAAAGHEGDSHENV
jgi:hypothetical protein